MPDTPALGSDDLGANDNESGSQPRRALALFHEFAGDRDGQVRDRDAELGALARMERSVNLTFERANAPTVFTTPNN
jgi:hypothetical protein